MYSFHLRWRSLFFFFRKKIRQSIDLVTQKAIFSNALMITLVPGQEITFTHLVREAKRSVEHILAAMLKLESRGLIWVFFKVAWSDTWSLLGTFLTKFSLLNNFMILENCSHHAIQWLVKGLLWKAKIGHRGQQGTSPCSGDNPWHRGNNDLTEMMNSKGFGSRAQAQNFMCLISCYISIGHFPLYYTCKGWYLKSANHFLKSHNDSLV